MYRYQPMVMTDGAVATKPRAQVHMWGCMCMPTTGEIQSMAVGCGGCWSHAHKCTQWSSDTVWGGRCVCVCVCVCVCMCV